MLNANLWIWVRHFGYWRHNQKEKTKLDSFHQKLYIKKTIFFCKIDFLNNFKKRCSTNNFFTKFSSLGYVATTDLKKKRLLITLKIIWVSVLAKETSTIYNVDQSDFFRHLFVRTFSCGVFRQKPSCHRNSEAKPNPCSNWNVIGDCACIFNQVWSLRLGESCN